MASELTFLFRLPQTLSGQEEQSLVLDLLQEVTKLSSLEPCRGKTDDFRRLAKSFYERTDVSFIWHNGKSDTKILIANGINGRIDHDTHLMSYALDERPGYHSLEYLLVKHLWLAGLRTSVR
jgi:DNA polymerase I-like protein with 3'-5' exonuclease and polymerase domains